MDCLSELHIRLFNNFLADEEDLSAYIQYASRLAALGDDSGLKELPQIFAKEHYAGRVSDIIKERCKKGWEDVANYGGEYLALAIIDANDFYCFMRRFGDGFPRLKPKFRRWWDDCNEVDIDDECAEMLEAFVEVFPLPEEDRLAVVDTPVTVREYAFLDFARRSGHPGVKWLDDLYKRELEDELEELEEEQRAQKEYDDFMAVILPAIKRDSEKKARATQPLQAVDKPKTGKKYVYRTAVLSISAVLIVSVVVGVLYFGKVGNNENGEFAGNNQNGEGADIYPIQKIELANANFAQWAYDPPYSPFNDSYDLSGRRLLTLGMDSATLQDKEIVRNKITYAADSMDAEDWLKCAQFAFMKENDGATAEEYIRKALILWSENVQINLNAAIIFYANGKKEEALEIYRSLQNETLLSEKTRNDITNFLEEQK